MPVQITGLTSVPSQKLTIADPNSGEPITLTLNYQVRTQEWYADISFGTWSLNGIRLYFSPNVLMQYSNSIAFGLAVITTDGLDPSLINDWVSGRASLILLDSSGVATVTAGIADGTFGVYSATYTIRYRLSTTNGIDIVTTNGQRILAPAVIHVGG